MRKGDLCRASVEQISMPADGAAPVYLCGNSLGLQPRGIRAAVLADLDRWAALGVEGAFCGVFLGGRF